MQIYNKKDFVPSQFLNVTQKKLTYPVLPHGHDFFEIEFVLSGKGTHLIDGVSYPIEPNSLFLLTPANVHEMRTDDVELITVMFQSEYSDGFFSFPILSLLHSPCFVFSGHEERLIREMIEEIYLTHTKDSSYAMMVLYCVLRKLHARSVPGSREVLPTVQNIIAYILEHFREEVTLKRTAGHFGFSVPYLSELFLQQTGRNFKEYLDSIRFSHAQNLLAFTSMPICEVNSRAGFSDYANFARRFKERTGFTPSQYRKRAREGRIREIGEAPFIKP